MKFALFRNICKESSQRVHLITTCTILDVLGPNVELNYINRGSLCCGAYGNGRQELELLHADHTLPVFRAPGEVYASAL